MECEACGKRNPLYPLVVEFRGLRYVFCDPYCADENWDALKREWQRTWWVTTYGVADATKASQGDER